jgi:(R,R)-butanediol dehydrogenase/meso-butanediol dehydrogenase/diacetyl reductase
MAKKLGVEVFNPSKHGHKSIEILRGLTKSHDGFDYSYDCSGIQVTFETSLKALTFRGTATNIAVWGPKPVPFQPMDVTLQEKVMTGSIGYVVEDFEEVVRAIHNGDIAMEDCKQLITGKQRIEDGWEKGFQELMDHKESNVKILLTPNNHGEMK